MLCLVLVFLSFLCSTTQNQLDKVALSSMTVLENTKVHIMFAWNCRNCLMLSLISVCFYL